MQTARGSVEVREPTKLEQTVARRVAESKATVPHIYLDARIEVRASMEAAELTPLVVKAVATALRERPTLNGAYRDGRFEAYSRVNVGITLPGEAVLVPTIFDADTKAVDEIAAEASALAAAAADGALASPQLAGGTFTILSVAEHAVVGLTPVVHSGQAGILALGGLADTAVVHNGKLEAGRVVQATLACDHRLVSAGEGAAFLARVKHLLEDG